jgi:hypothetical protein
MVNSGPSWATVVSTPCGQNRFAASATSDDDLIDDQPFIEQQSKRSRRLKRRQQDDQPDHSLVNNDNVIEQSGAMAPNAHADVHNRKRPITVIGKASVTGIGIAAARKLVRKAVFCIDNLNTSVTVNDIISFVSGLSVTVLSCFEAKPRRRRYETIAENRKAFRLCISEEHRSLLLDSAKWPESVTISEWYFKSEYQHGKSSGPTTSEKRPRTDSTPPHVGDLAIQSRSAHAEFDPDATISTASLKTME